MIRLLIVEDDRTNRDQLLEYCEANGFLQTVGVESAEEGLELLRHQAATAPFDAAILDVILPGMSGNELLQIIQREFPDLCVVMMTAFGSVDFAVQAMWRGAYYYLQKGGLEELQALPVIIRAGVTRNRLRRTQLQLVLQPNIHEWQTRITDVLIDAIPQLEHFFVAIVTGNDDVHIDLACDDRGKSISPDVRLSPESPLLRSVVSEKLPMLVKRKNEANVVGALMKETASLVAAPILGPLGNTE